MKRVFASLAVSSLFLACAAQAEPASAVAQTAVSAASPYQIATRIPLGDATKWDFLTVDPVRGRLFLSRAERVDVMNLETHQIVGSIPDTHGVHGIALDEGHKLGFISNGKANSVTVFDLNTLATVKTIPVTGQGPDVIMFEPTSQQVYVFNGKSNNIDVIDTKTQAITKTIAAGGKPEFAVADGHGLVYFHLEDKAEINVINAKTNTVVKSWKLAGCEEPSGMALDEAHHRLISACSNHVAVVSDANKHRVLASFAIGEHPDAAAYDAAKGLVFVSNGGGELTVARADRTDHYRVVEQLPTVKGAKTMALDSASHSVYLPAIVDNQFTVLVAQAKQ